MPSARFDAPLDLARVQSAGLWNSRLILVGALIAAASVLAAWGAVATGWGNWFTTTVIVIAAAASVSLVISSLIRRRMLLLLVGGSGTACSIAESGITLAGAPEIAWGDLEFIAILNDRPRTDRLRGVPLFGRLGELTIKAGSGTILCEIAVHDGEALRRRFPSGAAARRVTLYGRWPDGSRRGVLPLLLDAVLSEPATEAAVAAILSAATEHGVPTAMHDSTVANLRWKAPRLDPEWPRPVS
ncbi:hypothetical protein [Agromyces sp. NPDC056965]|uniref:hypothetical protein n=1 Tax=Agromyces sp. NPDC056965 TaxID=3345983 RepID=UPI00363914A7